MSNLPQPIIKIRLLAFTVGEPVDHTKWINISNVLLTGFSTTYTGGEIAAAITKIEFIDPTWELEALLGFQVYSGNKNRMLLCEYSFGHPDTKIWNVPGDGSKAEGGVAGPFIGACSKYTPEFTNEGMKVSLELYSSILTANLKMPYKVNERYNYKGDKNTMLSIIKEIAKEFDIAINFPKGEPIDYNFTDDKELKKIIGKEAGQTGLDYIVKLLKQYPMYYSDVGPALNTSTIRFNPLATPENISLSDQGTLQIAKMMGCLEIIPTDSLTNGASPAIRRVYSWNGDDSRIVSFEITIRPFIKDLNPVGTQVTSVDIQNKTITKTSDASGTASNSTNTDSQKVVVTEATSKEVAQARAASEQKALFQQMFRGKLKTFLDFNIFNNDLLQINIYSRLTGMLVVSKMMKPYTVTHAMEEGQLYTTFDLLDVADAKAIADVTRGYESATVGTLKDLDKANFYTDLQNAIGNFLPKF